MASKSLRQYINAMRRHDAKGGKKNGVLHVCRFDFGARPPGDETNKRLYKRASHRDGWGEVIEGARD